MKYFLRKIVSVSLASLIVIGSACAFLPSYAHAATSSDTITLRVCNWEEYIDEGDWDETIDLESGDIKGENSMVADFEDWYYKTYGKKVKVEYSCLGTNEELYNMLTLGDEYDLVCPSEYMIMKLMSEDRLEPFSNDFYDKNIKENYYSRGVSPFIKNMFDSNEINGEAWSRYAAGYMWGITGIIYNPDAVSKEEASTWTIINNSRFKRQITIKDNVRDSMFAAIGAIKSDKLTSKSFLASKDYKEKLAQEMNDTSDDTIKEVMSYFEATFKDILTSNEMSVMKENIMALNNKTEIKTAVSRRLNGVTSKDLYHLARNIGKRLGCSNMQIAHFIKKSFQLMLEDTEILTISSKLTCNEGRFTIKIIPIGTPLVAQSLPLSKD